jgi:hypothetical protein
MVRDSNPWPFPLLDGFRLQCMALMISPGIDNRKQPTLCPHASSSLPKTLHTHTIGAAALRYDQGDKKGVVSIMQLIFP